MFAVSVNGVAILVALIYEPPWPLVIEFRSYYSSPRGRRMPIIVTPQPNSYVSVRRTEPMDIPGYDRDP